MIGDVRETFTFNTPQEDSLNLLEEAELGLCESHLVKTSLRKIPLKITQVPAEQADRKPS